VVVKDVNVKAESDSVFFECDKVQVKLRIVAAEETTSQMDREHIVLFVYENQVLFFVYFKPTCLVIVVVVSDYFDSFVQRAYVVFVEAVSDFWTVHIFDF